MKTRIENEFLTVTIDSKGAEITSIKQRGTKELLWQGDKEAWDRQAPVLFPWTGRIVGKKYSHNGKDYDAPIHGFLRDEEHTIITNSDKTRVSFEVKYDKPDSFPFSFYAKQTFSLKNQTLSHSITITNTSNETLPFGFGFHPGFLCPFSEGASATDYCLVFDSPQTAHEVLMPKGHTTGEENLYIENTESIQLSDSFFTSDSVCLKGLTSKTISLHEKDSNNKIVVDIGNFPYVLLWSAPTPSLRFVCIEPWLTVPDYEDAPKEWSKKKNLLNLEPNTDFKTDLAMSFFFE